MMYPFMTLNDDTEIATSDIQADGRIKVCIEKPDNEWGLKSMICYLPEYHIQSVYHFSEEEIQRYLELLRKNEHVITQLAEEGL